MIFSRKGRGAGALLSRGDSGLDSRAESLDALFERIESLSRANATEHDPDVAREILQLRHRAGLELIENPPVAAPDFASADAAAPSTPNGVPEVAAGDLTPGLLRAAMLNNGCLLVRGLVSGEEAAEMVAGIDRAYEARAAAADGRPGDSAYFEPFVPDPRFDLETERGWVRDGAGLWGADSPRVMSDVLDAFERTGLRRLATDYLGERSAISVNKCLLRKVNPKLFEQAAAAAGTEGPQPSAWHQDGAFLGNVRALNVWLALSRCGDVAPGMDLVPRRLDHIVPTGTEGACFEWSASQQVAEEAAGDAGIVRPVFEPGDALLFDELFLHSTAAEPDMPNERYAVESWFFGGSAFPNGYAPLAF